MGEGRTLEKPVPAQLHGQTQRPCLHVGRQRFYQTSSSTWYSSYSMGRDSRGKGSVKFKVLSPSPGPPDAPTPVFHTLLTPRALDQGPGGLPAAWTLIRPQPPGLRSGCPSKAFPHLPHQVKCYLSLEARLKSFLCLLSSSVSLPVSPGILYFPACGLFVWSFCSSQHRAGALSLLCCSSCSRVSGAPSTLLGKAWLKYEVWDQLLGHE